MSSICVIRLNGRSGSGKTTLIEKTLPELKKEALSVGVIKHTGHHKLSPDREGKDTDRFYRAGADFVLAQDLLQGFARFASKDEGLEEAIAQCPRGLDLILVEGYKSADAPVILLHSGELDTARENSDTLGKIDRSDPQYKERFLELVLRHLKDFHSRRPVAAGLLAGGKSSRMGTPKALLKYKGETFIRRSLDALRKVSGKTVLLGPTEVLSKSVKAESLPDAPGVRGPMAGILSAFRWNPENAWIISAVDMPLMDAKAWNWLLGQRRPGAWAVLPRTSTGGKVETTGACYEPEIFEYVESLSRKGIFGLQALADHPKIISPVIPQSIAAAWKNVNTPEDLKDIHSV